MPLRLTDPEIENLQRMEDAKAAVEDAFHQLTMGGTSTDARILTTAPDALGQFFCDGCCRERYTVRM